MLKGDLAGLRPAPAVVQAAGRQRQRQRQKLVSCGEAGWVRLQGTLQVPLRGPAAAGGCAFGRLRSSASQAKRPHPCKLGRAIHGAHAPATGPTPPSTGSCDLSGRRSARLLVGVDLGRHAFPKGQKGFSATR
ncbi:hypothetical protein E4420_01500 [Stenotrophomonas maltophilia]|nr:hypothetical protein [Stenotrophomonas maltophilia]MBA0288511.1 hypothetical protein [Stenotrophomonas maltophilia]MBA0442885.1 hypothetical protein [Stenotrophomonas maltophilia]PJL57093.1 hypothetical protein B9Y73_01875 [Stenotrophomonas maltophilia]PJL62410.1 hypothetical protein B9Y60_01875 [Stenotrophomonas maltophilia]